MIKVLQLYWKSMFVFCFIFYVSVIHISVAHLPHFPHQDKLIHIILYFTLSAMIYIDITRAKTPLSKTGFFLIVLATPIIYGGIIELLQDAFFPPRTADWFDFFANSFGSLLSFLLMHFFIFRKR